MTGEDEGEAYADIAKIYRRTGFLSIRLGRRKKKFVLILLLYLRL